MSPKLLNIILILVPTALYLGFITPILEGTSGLGWAPERTIAALQSQNVAYANALNQVGEIERSAQKINKDFLAITPEIQATTSIMLPNSIDPIKLRSEVITIADNAGIAISGLSVVPTILVGKGNVEAYTVSFSLKTRYATFKKIMEVYEKNLRFFIISSITIRRPEGGQVGSDPNAPLDKEALDIRVTFRVHYLK